MDALTSKIPHGTTQALPQQASCRSEKQANNSLTHLLDIVFRQRFRCDIHRILLHLVGHISIFYHSLALLAHGVKGKWRPVKSKRESVWSRVDTICGTVEVRTAMVCVGGKPGDVDSVPEVELLTLY